ncbi:hypothetical protein RIF29_27060 [Crotalaria pallida]|uniref:RNase H type-1 domain-containing protein n=1 Tax=Crotalaria pallida TaxID=3830 RepID=A0AAN9EVM6_CROPI
MPYGSVASAGFGGSGDALLAELLAIRHGLLLVWELDIKFLICQSDFNEAIRFVNLSSVPPFHAYGAILGDISYLLSRDWMVQMQHSLREDNYVVDGLAKWGSSHIDLDVVWKSPPNYLDLALLADNSGVVHLR